MESKNALVQDIKDDLTYIETEKKVLEVKKREFRDIQAKIKVLDKKILNRKDKIELLSLTVEEGKLSEFIEKTAVEVEKKERELEEKNKRLEEVQKKPFLQRLLRR